MTQSSLQHTSRIYSFDIIRIVATLAVIMIHTSGTFLSISAPNTLTFAVANLLDSLSQIAVPLFIMLSGALMLNEQKEITVRKSLKYALNIFVLLYIWSLFYAVTYTFLVPMLTNQAVSFSLSNFFKDILFGHYHMWYLFIIIGLYLITPLLRLFVKKSNSKIILYFLIIAIIVKFIPSLLDLICFQLTGIEFIVNYVDKFSMDYFSQYLIYYILGWYVTTIEISKKQRTAIYISGVAGFLVTFGLTELMAGRNPDVYKTLYSNQIINIFLSTLATFVFIFYLFKGKSPGKSQGFITCISKLTFGVYIIHELIRTVISEVLSSLTDNHLLAIFLCFTLTAVLSFGISFVLSKIPLVKKLVKC